MVNVLNLQINIIVDCLQGFNKLDMITCKVVIFEKEFLMLVI